ncbi:MAG: hypothetical protein HWN80_06710 [Candidatus Lokiarchaeota archaeon]|nr:hypothetical protein [Candidatus Lokiarchaeota archaeon]
MIEDELTSQIIDIEACKTELVKKYTTFLAQYPEIFADLISGSHFDFAIYDSIESYDSRTPIDVFNVYRTSEGIEIKSGKANNPDLELALSVQAIKKLIKTKDNVEYAQLLGSFYNEPNEQSGWIDFMLFQRTQKIIEMGYGKFAQTAGILEDDGSIINL